MIATATETEVFDSAAIVMFKDGSTAHCAVWSAMGGQFCLRNGVEIPVIASWGISQYAERNLRPDRYVTKMQFASALGPGAWFVFDDWDCEVVAMFAGTGPQSEEAAHRDAVMRNCIFWGTDAAERD